MADPVSDNLLMLMRVVDRLAPLRHRLVFLGGAVAELFITLPGVLRPRQTKDVDVVVNVVNLGEYSETLRDQLIALGLRSTVARRSSPTSLPPPRTCGRRSRTCSRACSRCQTPKT
ncbi:MAG: hypothetical protein ISS73_10430 [Pirellulales bacterium]|nr:hypothetical protein [Pirellulales bacterium]